MSKITRLEDIRFLIPLYGDIPIFLSFFKVEGWQKQYQIWIKGDIPAFLSDILRLCGFFINVYALPTRVVLRYRHGILTIGWFLTAFTALTITFFNWTNRGHWWTPLYTIWYPIREMYNNAFHPDSPNWWPDLISNYYSINLWWFCVLFCGLTAIHILISYFTSKDAEQSVQRGIPLLWKLSTLFSKKMLRKERLAVWWVLETAIVGGVGFCLYRFGFDRALGLFLCYSAACHFVLELYEFIGLKKFISK